MVILIESGIGYPDFAGVDERAEWVAREAEFDADPDRLRHVHVRNRERSWECVDADVILIGARTYPQGADSDDPDYLAWQRGRYCHVRFNLGGQSRARYVRLDDVEILGQGSMRIAPSLAMLLASLTLTSPAALANEPLYPVVQMTLPPLGFRTMQSTEALMHEIGRIVGSSPTTTDPVLIEIDADTSEHGRQLQMWIAEANTTRPVILRIFVNPKYPSLTVAAYTTAISSYTKSPSAVALQVRFPEPSSLPGSAR